jgi:hypothetical protein
MKLVLCHLFWLTVLSAQNPPVLVMRNAVVIDGVSAQPQHGVTGLLRTVVSKRGEGFRCRSSRGPHLKNPSSCGLIPRGRRPDTDPSRGPVG